MPVEEQQRRNRIMRRRIERYDVVRWAHDFIEQTVHVPELQDRFTTKYLTTDLRKQIARDFSAASQRLLLLDYDGTLTPLVRSPELARPATELLTALGRLSAMPGTTLAIVSGRERSTLERWLGSLDAHLVAEHGIWWRPRGGEWQLEVSGKGDWKLRLLPMLESYADRLPGSFVEEKEHSVVWHYRLSDPEHGALLAAEAFDHLTTLTANYDVQVNRGNKIVEVRPIGVHKGTMALKIINLVQPDFVLAAGDDVTDEDLFKALPPPAHTIKVGIGSTQAQFTVGHTADVVRLLEALSGA